MRRAKNALILWKIDPLIVWQNGRAQRKLFDLIISNYTNADPLFCQKGEGGIGELQFLLDKGSLTPYPSQKEK